MRSSFLLTLLLFASTAGAQWSGVALEVSDFDSEWRFDGGNRDAQFRSIGFQFEDKTTSGLRVGASFGIMDLRLIARSIADSESVDGEYAGLYLYQPFRIAENLALHSLLSYRYISATDTADDITTEINWNEARFEIGASLRVYEIRIMPFASYTDLDGDFSDDRGTEVFSLDSDRSRGIRIDYFVDFDAFVRFELIAGAHDGGYLKFVRRY